MSWYEVGDPVIYAFLDALAEIDEFIDKINEWLLDPGWEAFLLAGSAPGLPIAAAGLIGVGVQIPKLTPMAHAMLGEFPRADEEQAAELSRQWAAAAEEVGSWNEEARAEAVRILAEQVWSGQSADSFSSTMADYTAALDDLQGSLNNLAGGVGEFAQAVAYTKGLYRANLVLMLGELLHLVYSAISTYGASLLGVPAVVTLGTRAGRQLIMAGIRRAGSIAIPISLRRVAVSGFGGAARTTGGVLARGGVGATGGALARGGAAAGAGVVRRGANHLFSGAAARASSNTVVRELGRQLGRAGADRATRRIVERQLADALAGRAPTAAQVARMSAKEQAVAGAVGRFMASGATPWSVLGGRVARFTVSSTALGVGAELAAQAQAADQGVGYTPQWQSTLQAGVGAAAASAFMGTANTTAGYVATGMAGGAAAFTANAAVEAALNPDLGFKDALGVESFAELAEHLGAEVTSALGMEDTELAGAAKLGAGESLGDALLGGALEGVWERYIGSGADNMGLGKLDERVGALGDPAALSALTPLANPAAQLAPPALLSGAPPGAGGVPGGAGTAPAGTTASASPPSTGTSTSPGASAQPNGGRTIGSPPGEADAGNPEHGKPRGRVLDAPSAAGGESDTAVAGSQNEEPEPGAPASPDRGDSADPAAGAESTVSEEGESAAAEADQTGAVERDAEVSPEPTAEHPENAGSAGNTGNTENGKSHEDADRTVSGDGQAVAGKDMAAPSPESEADSTSGTVAGTGSRDTTEPVLNLSELPDPDSVELAERQAEALGRSRVTDGSDGDTAGFPSERGWSTETLRQAAVDVATDALREPGEGNVRLLNDRLLLSGEYTPDGRTEPTAMVVTAETSGRILDVRPGTLPNTADWTEGTRAALLAALGDMQHEGLLHVNSDDASIVVHLPDGANVVVALRIDPGLAAGQTYLDTSAWKGKGEAEERGRPVVYGVSSKGLTDLPAMRKERRAQLESLIEALERRQQPASGYAKTGEVAPERAAALERAVSSAVSFFDPAGNRDIPYDAVLEPGIEMADEAATLPVRIGDRTVRVELALDPETGSGEARPRVAVKPGTGSRLQVWADLRRTLDRLVTPQQAPGASPAESPSTESTAHRPSPEVATPPAVSERVVKEAVLALRRVLVRSHHGPGNVALAGSGSESYTHPTRAVVGFDSVTAGGNLATVFRGGRQAGEVFAAAVREMGLLDGGPAHGIEWRMVRTQLWPDEADEFMQGLADDLQVTVAAAGMLFRPGARPLDFDVEQEAVAAERVEGMRANGTEMSTEDIPEIAQEIGLWSPAPPTSTTTGASAPARRASLNPDASWPNLMAMSRLLHAQGAIRDTPLKPALRDALEAGVRTDKQLAERKGTLRRLVRAAAPVVAAWLRADGIAVDDKAVRKRMRQLLDGMTVVPGDGPARAQLLTDPDGAQRVQVWPRDGMALTDLIGVLAHEVTHSFQHEVSGSPAGRSAEAIVHREQLAHWVEGRVYEWLGQHATPLRDELAATARWSRELVDAVVRAAYPEDGAYAGGFQHLPDGSGTREWAAAGANGTFDERSHSDAVFRDSTGRIERAEAIDLDAVLDDYFGQPENRRFGHVVDRGEPGRRTVELEDGRRVDIELRQGTDPSQVRVDLPGGRREGGMARLDGPAVIHPPLLPADDHLGRTVGRLAVDTALMWIMGMLSAPGAEETAEPTRTAPTVKATFRGARVHGDASSLPAELRPVAEHLAEGMELRAAVQQDAAAATGRKVRGRASALRGVLDPGVHALDSKDWEAFEYLRRQLGEGIGELAGTQMVHDLEAELPEGHRFEQVEFPLESGVESVGASGRFDQIHREVGPDGRYVVGGRYVVVEAKGPAAGLGGRRGPGGDSRRYQQGHPRYVEAILETMAGRGGIDAVVADELWRAWAQGRLDYRYAKARVEQETSGGGTGRYGHQMPRYAGYESAVFDIGTAPQRPDPPPAPPVPARLADEVGRLTARVRADVISTALPGRDAVAAAAGVTREEAGHVLERLAAGMFELTERDVRETLDEEALDRLKPYLDDRGPRAVLYPDPETDRGRMGVRLRDGEADGEGARATSVVDLAALLVHEAVHEAGRDAHRLSHAVPEHASRRQHVVDLEERADNAVRLFLQTIASRASLPDDLADVAGTAERGGWSRALNQEVVGLLDYLPDTSDYVRNVADTTGVRPVLLAGASSPPAGGEGALSARGERTPLSGAGAADGQAGTVQDIDVLADSLRHLSAAASGFAPGFWVDRVLGVSGDAVTAEVRMLGGLRAVVDFRFGERAEVRTPALRWNGQNWVQSEPATVVLDAMPSAQRLPAFLERAFVVLDATLGRQVEHTGLPGPNQIVPDTGVPSTLEAAESRAREVADRVLDDLREVVGAVNADSGLAEGDALTLAGTENRVKSSASLARKFDAESRLAGRSIDEFLDEVHDRVRFALRLPETGYGELAAHVLTRLVRDHGYTVDTGPGNGVRNYWRAGNRYLGMHAYLRSPDGFLFELQLPTARSWDMVNRTHGDYGVVRSAHATPVERVHAFLEVLRANKEERLSATVPELTALADVPGVTEAGLVARRRDFASWASARPDIMRGYAERLVETGRTFDDELAAHGLDRSDVPGFDPEVHLGAGRNADVVLPGSAPAGHAGASGERTGDGELDRSTSGDHLGPDGREVDGEPGGGRDTAVRRGGERAADSGEQAAGGVGRDGAGHGAAERAGTAGDGPESPSGPEVGSLSPGEGPNRVAVAHAVPAQRRLPYLDEAASRITEVLREAGVFTEAGERLEAEQLNRLLLPSFRELLSTTPGTGGRTFVVTGSGGTAEIDARLVLATGPDGTGPVAGRRTNAPGRITKFATGQRRVTEPKVSSDRSVRQSYTPRFSLRRLLDPLGSIYAALGLERDPVADVTPSAMVAADRHTSSDADWSTFAGTGDEHHGSFSQYDLDLTLECEVRTDALERTVVAGADPTGEREPLLVEVYDGYDDPPPERQERFFSGAGDARRPRRWRDEAELLSASRVYGYDGSPALLAEAVRQLREIGVPERELRVGGAVRGQLIDHIAARACGASGAAAPGRPHRLLVHDSRGRPAYEVELSTTFRWDSATPLHAASATGDILHGSNSSGATSGSTARNNAWGAEPAVAGGLRWGMMLGGLRGFFSKIGSTVDIGSATRQDAFDVRPKDTYRVPGRTTVTTRRLTGSPVVAAAQSTRQLPTTVTVQVATEVAARNGLPVDPGTFLRTDDGSIDVRIVAEPPVDQHGDVVENARWGRREVPLVRGGFEPPRDPSAEGERANREHALSKGGPGINDDVTRVTGMHRFAGAVLAQLAEQGYTLARQAAGEQLSPVAARHWLAEALQEGKRIPIARRTPSGMRPAELVITAEWDPERATVLGYGASTRVTSAALGRTEVGLSSERAAARGRFWLWGKASEKFRVVTDRTSGGLRWVRYGGFRSRYLGKVTHWRVPVGLRAAIADADGIRPLDGTEVGGQIAEVKTPLDTAIDPARGGEHIGDAARAAAVDFVGSDSAALQLDTRGVLADVEPHTATAGQRGRFRVLAALHPRALLARLPALMTNGVVINAERGSAVLRWQPEHIRFAGLREPTLQGPMYRDLLGHEWQERSETAHDGTGAYREDTTLDGQDGSGDGSLGELEDVGGHGIGSVQGAYAHDVARTEDHVAGDEELQLWYGLSVVFDVEGSFRTTARDGSPSGEGSTTRRARIVKSVPGVLEAYAEAELPGEAIPDDLVRQLLDRWRTDAAKLERRELRPERALQLDRRIVAGAAYRLAVNDALAGRPLDRGLLGEVLALYEDGHSVPLDRFIAPAGDELTEIARRADPADLVVLGRLAANLVLRSDAPASLADYRLPAYAPRPGAESYALGAARVVGFHQNPSADGTEAPTPYAAVADALRQAEGHAEGLDPHQRPDTGLLDRDPDLDAVLRDVLSGDTLRGVQKSALATGGTLVLTKPVRLANGQWMLVEVRHELVPTGEAVVDRVLPGGSAQSYGDMVDTVRRDDYRTSMQGPEAEGLGAGVPAGADADFGLGPGFSAAHGGTRDTGTRSRAGRKHGFLDWPDAVRLGLPVEARYTARLTPLPGATGRVIEAVRGRAGGSTAPPIVRTVTSTGTVSVQYTEPKVAPERADPARAVWLDRLPEQLRPAFDHIGLRPLTGGVHEVATALLGKLNRTEELSLQEMLEQRAFRGRWPRLASDSRLPLPSVEAGRLRSLKLWLRLDGISEYTVLARYDSQGRHGLADEESLRETTRIGQASITERTGSVAALGREAEPNGSGSSGTGPDEDALDMVGRFRARLRAESSTGTSLETGHERGTVLEDLRGPTVRVRLRMHLTVGGSLSRHIGSLLHRPLRTETGRAEPVDVVVQLYEHEWTALQRRMEAQQATLAEQQALLERAGVSADDVRLRLRERERAAEAEPVDLQEALRQERERSGHGDPDRPWIATARAVREHYPNAAVVNVVDDEFAGALAHYDEIAGQGLDLAERVRAGLAGHSGERADVVGRRLAEAGEAFGELGRWAGRLAGALDQVRELRATREALASHLAGLEKRAEDGETRRRPRRRLARARQALDAADDQLRQARLALAALEGEQRAVLARARAGFDRLTEAAADTTALTGRNVDVPAALDPAQAPPRHDPRVLAHHLALELSHTGHMVDVLYDHTDRDGTTTRFYAGIGGAYEQARRTPPPEQVETDTTEIAGGTDGDSARTANVQPAGADPLELAGRFGVSLREQRALRRVADTHGVVFRARPSGAHGSHWWKSGALAKPEAVKMKTINELDVFLGADPRHLGLVGYFAPRMDPDAVPMELRAAVRERARQRAAEFENPENRRVVESGRYAVVDGVVVAVVESADPRAIVENTAGVGPDGEPTIRPGRYVSVEEFTRPVLIAGDLDLFDVTTVDGSPLPDETLRRILAELREAGVRVEHGPHLYWEPRTEGQLAIFESIMNRHLPGGEPLVRIAPGERTSLTHADEARSAVLVGFQRLWAGSAGGSWPDRAWVEVLLGEVFELSESGVAGLGVDVYTERVLSDMVGRGVAGVVVWFGDSPRVGVRPGLHPVERALTLVKEIVTASDPIDREGVAGLGEQERFEFFVRRELSHHAAALRWLRAYVEGLSSGRRVELPEHVRQVAEWSEDTLRGVVEFRYGDALGARWFIERAVQAVAGGHPVVEAARGGDAVEGPGEDGRRPASPERPVTPDDILPGPREPGGELAAHPSDGDQPADTAASPDVPGGGTGEGEHANRVADLGPTGLRLLGGVPMGEGLLPHMEQAARQLNAYFARHGLADRITPQELGRLLVSDWPSTASRDGLLLTFANGRVRVTLRLRAVPGSDRIVPSSVDSTQQARHALQQGTAKQGHPDGHAVGGNVPGGAKMEAGDDSVGGSAGGGRGESFDVVGVNSVDGYLSALDHRAEATPLSISTELVMGVEHGGRVGPRYTITAPEGSPDGDVVVATPPVYRHSPPASHQRPEHEWPPARRLPHVYPLEVTGRERLVAAARDLLPRYMRDDPAVLEQLETAVKTATQSRFADTARKGFRVTVVDRLRRPHELVIEADVDRRNATVVTTAVPKEPENPEGPLLLEKVGVEFNESANSAGSAVPAALGGEASPAGTAELSRQRRESASAAAVAIGVAVNRYAGWLQLTRFDDVRFTVSVGDASNTVAGQQALLWGREDAFHDYGAPVAAEAVDAEGALRRGTLVATDDVPEHPDFLSGPAATGEATWATGQAIVDEFTVADDPGDGVEWVRERLRGFGTELLKPHQDRLPANQLKQLRLMNERLISEQITPAWFERQYDQLSQQGVDVPLRVPASLTSVKGYREVSVRVRLDGHLPEYRGDRPDWVAVVLDIAMEAVGYARSDNLSRTVSALLAAYTYARAGEVNATNRANSVSLVEVNGVSIFVQSGTLRLEARDENGEPLRDTDGRALTAERGYTVDLGVATDLVRATGSHVASRDTVPVTLVEQGNVLSLHVPDAARAMEEVTSARQRRGAARGTALRAATSVGMLRARFARLFTAGATVPVSEDRKPWRQDSSARMVMPRDAEGRPEGRVSYLGFSDKTVCGDIVLRLPSFGTSRGTSHEIRLGLDGKLGWLTANIAQRFGWGTATRIGETLGRENIDIDLNRKFLFRVDTRLETTGDLGRGEATMTATIALSEPDAIRMYADGELDLPAETVADSLQRSHKPDEPLKLPHDVARRAANRLDTDGTGVEHPPAAAFPEPELPATVPEHLAARKGIGPYGVKSVSVHTMRPDGSKGDAVEFSGELGGLAAGVTGRAPDGLTTLATEMMGAPDRIKGLLSLLTGGPYPLVTVPARRLPRWPFGLSRDGGWRLRWDPRKLWHPSVRQSAQLRIRDAAIVGYDPRRLGEEQDYRYAERPEGRSRRGSTELGAEAGLLGAVFGGGVSRGSATSTTTARQSINIRHHQGGLGMYEMRVTGELDVTTRPGRGAPHVGTYLVEFVVLVPESEVEGTPAEAVPATERGYPEITELPQRTFGQFVDGGQLRGAVHGLLSRFGSGYLDAVEAALAKRYSDEALAINIAEQVRGVSWTVDDVGRTGRSVSLGTRLNVSDAEVILWSEKEAGGGIGNVDRLQQTTAISMRQSDGGNLRAGELPLGALSGAVDLSTSSGVDSVSGQRRENTVKTTARLALVRLTGNWTVTARESGFDGERELAAGAARTTQPLGEAYVWVYERDLPELLDGIRPPDLAERQRLAEDSSFDVDVLRGLLAERADHAPVVDVEAVLRDASTDPEPRLAVARAFAVAAEEAETPRHRAERETAARYRELFGGQNAGEPLRTFVATSDPLGDRIAQHERILIAVRDRLDRLERERPGQVDPSLRDDLLWSEIAVARLREARGAVAQQSSDSSGERVATRGDMEFAEALARWNPWAGRAADLARAVHALPGEVGRRDAALPRWVEEFEATYRRSDPAERLAQVRDIARKLGIEIQLRQVSADGKPETRIWATPEGGVYYDESDLGAKRVLAGAREELRTRRLDPDAVAAQALETGLPVDKAMATMPNGEVARAARYGVNIDAVIQSADRGGYDRAEALTAATERAREDWTTDVGGFHRALRDAGFSSTDLSRALAGDVDLIEIYRDAWRLRWNEGRQIRQRIDQIAAGATPRSVSELAPLFGFDDSSAGRARFRALLGEAGIREAETGSGELTREHGRLLRSLAADLLLRHGLTATQRGRLLEVDRSVLANAVTHRSVGAHPLELIQRFLPTEDETAPEPAVRIVERIYYATPELTAYRGELDQRVLRRVRAALRDHGVRHAVWEATMLPGTSFRGKLADVDVDMLLAENGTVP
ncbi:WXG100-like domain-containing protein [Qaidamihabitans albus]|uniref:WXG100-like domain-containing protein n=1 Tax=Qaidamihabitans albus TaxID=2795733 RepID=UPI0018F246FC|nr:hypothetical protein [Qaidamihabitans albus]